MGALKTRTLGKSGIQVTEIGMGLWAAGGEGWGPTDDRAVLDAIDVALDAGVNFFDTSDVYGAGHSEELLGQAMRGRRDRFIVASKIGWQGFDRARDRSAYDSVAKLIAGVEGNLRRLQTDYIDVMQSHIDHRDPTMARRLFAGGQALPPRLGALRPRRCDAGGAPGPSGRNRRSAQAFAGDRDPAPVRRYDGDERV